MLCPTFVSVESDGVMIVDDLIEALKEHWHQTASFEHAGELAAVAVWLVRLWRYSCAAVVL